MQQGGPRQRNASWALVVGHAGGIGSALVPRLRAQGMSVVGIDRSAPAMTSDDVESILACVNDQESTSAVLEPVLSRRGPPPVAAIAIGTYRRILLSEYDQRAFEEILADNFSSVFWIARMLSASMSAGGGGRIAIVTSQAGVNGGADPVYAAAKAATVALVKSIAREFGASGLRCNAVSPGPVDTRMAQSAMSSDRVSYYKSQIPIGRFSRAEEIAEALEFLLIGPSSINGATIDVDGGLVRR